MDCFSDQLLNFVLENEFQIKHLNKVQIEFIKQFDDKKNLLLVSQTGSGKTFAFLLPILQRLDLANKKAQAVIICPTNVLLTQIEKILLVFKKHNQDLRIINLNKAYKKDKDVNVANNHIVLLTPKKLVDLKNQNDLLNNLDYLVIDEVDMVVEFYDELKKIFNYKKVQSSTKIILTSATFHKKLSSKLGNELKNHLVLNFSDSIWKNQNIKHYFINTTTSNKYDTLKQLMEIKNPFLGVIFCSTKQEVKQLFDRLNQEVELITYFDGTLNFQERKSLLKRIKNNQYQWVVASDIFARGIDLEQIDLIISWDLPKDLLFYVHRSGRSSRRNKLGESYVFADEINKTKLESLIKKGIEFNESKIQQGQIITLKNKKPYFRNKEQELQIKQAIKHSDKTIKPNYKKKLKEQIKKIKQKNKRKHIEKLVNQTRIKKYKQQSAKKALLKAKNNNN